MSLLCLRNPQRARRIDLRLLRQIVLFILKEVFQEPRFELGIRLVSADEMAKINETFLQHVGSTDVVTFDYSQNAADTLAAEKFQAHSEVGPPTEGRQHVLHGEIFISIDDAVAQAKQFRAIWQSELARYVVHGLLHLRGFDDLNPAARRKMKREENRVLNLLSHRFPLNKLQRQPKSKNG